MKRKIKILIQIFVILAVLYACSEDWLKPDALSFYVPENVFVDEEGFESALIRCRKEMNAENHGASAHNLLVAEFGYSDIAIASKAPDFSKNTPSSSSLAVLNLFLDAYGFIKNANTVISRIDDIEWSSQEKKNRVLAEALWFRSYWYYRLVNSYGDIPWVGKELKGPKINYYSTSRWAILSKIQQDLEFAAEWLPATQENLGNVTRGAANHLLAKVYLANCEFDKAIQSATNVINGPYSLMEERFGSYSSKSYYNVMWDLHRVENKNLAANTENIYCTVDRLEAAPSSRWNEIGTYSMRLYGASYWHVLDATGNRATNWNTPSGDTLGIGSPEARINWYYYYTIWNDENYTWKNTPDLRRQDCNWVEMGDSVAEIITVREGSPNLGEPLTREYFKNINDTNVWWFPYPNYKLFVPTPHYSHPYGGPGDWYIFRLAETYLLRAEAYYWKGENQKAADDVNVVRLRAKAPLISTDKVDIEYIFDERARELFVEEPRHSELVRVSYIFAKLNRDGYSLNSISQKNWYYDRVMRINQMYHPPVYNRSGDYAQINPENMLWPIPQEVITANTNGRINQNIGYEGAEYNEPPLESISDE